MVEHNMRTFANITIGIHGHELPKFASPHLVPESHPLHPINSEANLAYRSSKERERRLGDVDPSANAGLPDRHKVPRLSLHKKDGLCPKVTEVHPELQESPNSKPRHKGSPVAEVSNRYFSVYEDSPADRPSLVQGEQAPLYSSFNPEGVFDYSRKANAR
jgi:hypothetical protein